MNLPGYDNWKLRSPEDDCAMRYPSARRGVYTVTVTRTLYATVEVEVEASSEEDALFDATVAAGRLPLDRWTIDQDDFDTTDVEGPPERDPDLAREDRMDRERDRW